MPGADDFDIVSDLAEDNVISANHGAVDANQAPQPTESTRQPTKVDTQEKPVAAKPTSLRDQISSAIKGETPKEAAPEGQEKPRNPDGTFAAKPADQAAAAPQTQNPAPSQPAPGAVQVPQGFDPAVFNALPAETQVQLARTMEDVNNRFSRLVGYEQIEQLIAPRRQPWALNGMTEAQALNQLFALSDYATRDPAGFVKYFAQQSNVNLEDLVFGDDPVDPERQAYERRIQQLEGRLTQYETGQQQRQHQSLVDEVISFASEKGQDGNFLRPYLDEMGDAVMPFIQVELQRNPNASRQQILQAAYDNACWGIPSVRAKMQAAADAAAEAQRTQEAAQKAASARTAGSSVAPGVPSAPPPNPGDGSLNLRDTIRSTMASLS